MTAPLVVPLPGNDHLARGLADALDGEVGGLEHRHFPDRESYVRLDCDPEDRDVVLACSLHDPDTRTLPLLFAADAARDLGARSVALAAPYLGYMRQDARFRDGEAVTSVTYADVLSARVDRLVTVDPHLHRHEHLSDIYSVPAVAVAAAPAVAEWIEREVPDPVLVGPDEESEQWTADVAGRIDAPHLVLTKTRRGDREVSVTAPDPEALADRTPVVLDDIISSARTMVAAVEAVRRAGGREGGRAPVCVGVHALFAGDAEQALERAGAARVVTTDTVPHPSNAIPVAPLLAAALAGGA